MLANAMFQGLTSIGPSLGGRHRLHRSSVRLEGPMGLVRLHPSSSPQDQGPEAEPDRPVSGRALPAPALLLLKPVQHPRGRGRSGAP